MKFKSLVASKLYELHKLANIGMSVRESGFSHTTEITCVYRDSKTIKAVCENFRSCGHLIKVISIGNEVVQGFSYTYTYN